MWTNRLRLVIPWPCGRRARPVPAARRASHCRLGQATVEFVLTSLIFLPIVLGTIEIGRGVWYYNQLSQLSREGVRWLIVTTADNSTAHSLVGNTPGTYTAATCSCDPNTAVGWIRRQEIGIPQDQLTITVERGTVLNYTWGMPVTVTVQYPYRPLVSTFLGIPATITMRAATTMHMQ
jgi:Flp pilus assembly protein TadG